MKSKFLNPLCLSLLCAGLALASTALAQSTAFTYQGLLKDGANAATGLYDMKFSLHDSENSSAVLGSPLVATMPVTNGLFTVLLDFGSAPFNGNLRWLEVGVRPGGSSSGMAYTPQLPRAALTPTPYAIYAQKSGNVANGAITSSQLAANAVNSSAVAANAITAPKIADGQVVKSLNGLKDNVSLVAGANVTLTPSGNNLTIASTAGGFSVSGNNAYYTAGSVGIGTATPSSSYALDVLGTQRIRGDLNIDGGGNLIFGSAASEGELGVFALLSASPPHLMPPTRFTVKRNGFVGIGTSNPQERLHVTGGSLLVEGPRGQQAYVGADHTPNDIELGSLNAAVTAVHLWNRGYGGGMDLGLRDLAYSGTQVKLDVADNFVATVRAADFLLGYSGRRGSPGRALVDLGDTLVVNYASDWANTVIGGNNVSVCKLTITGGCDLAEPFQMSEEKIPEGSVVVIDEANPGRLKQATSAYDTRVAGIISGAGGVSPGIALKQEGVLDQGQNVALTGRVYVKADAGYGAIKPGDLLTTSDTAGHAMKVGDHTRAPGTILGKAMSALETGTGLVLVLVTLQ